jgi:hypothetical protein
MSRKKLVRIGISDIFTFTEKPSVYFFEAGMTIDADGAYEAYHPVPGKGLDFLGNGGEPGNWWALVTDTGKKTGKPVVQGPTDPAPGFYISMTSLQDKTKNRVDPTRYVDSSSIPFYVLPGNKTNGAALGDFGYVINPKNGKACGCLYADSGPAGRIGEGSVALAKALGIPNSPKHGGIGHGLAYVVFTGTKGSWPIGPPDIKARGRELFEAWGGLDRIKAGLPDIDWD